MGPSHSACGLQHIHRQEKGHTVKATASPTAHQTPCGSTAWAASVTWRLGQAEAFPGAGGPPQEVPTGPDTAQAEEQPQFTATSSRQGQLPLPREPARPARRALVP